MSSESSPLAENSKINPQALKPLRVWPALTLLVGMLLARFIPVLAEAESNTMTILQILGPVGLGILIILWWLAFSRASKKERWLGLLGLIILACISIRLSHPTILGPGNIIVTFPLGVGCFAIGAAILARKLSASRTWLALLLAMTGFGFSVFMKSDGMWGNGELDWSWRWEPSAEQTMLAGRDAAQKNSLEKPEAKLAESWIKNPEWPRFRGASGNSRFEGPALETDWKNNPPQEVWRRKVGPGWSSFAVAGKLLFTQEQHGEHEAVVCYAADTGNEVWIHKIQSRFDDPLGGPGPRATPTLSGGKLFVLGANGQLERLDPMTGVSIWGNDIGKLAERKPPSWGYTSSPLVIGSTVVVHAGGDGEKGTLAFDVESGELDWSASGGDHTYSSPELFRILGKDYIAMLTNQGLRLLDTKTGVPQLDYEWVCGEYRSLQPQTLDADKLLLPTQDLGTRLIKLTRVEQELQAEELWTSKRLKPDFNDFVIHNNHAYGFDGRIFVCIDVKTGELNWKGGRYGKGQVLLLPNSEAVLVLSEKGEAVLVKTNPEKHQELTRFHALQGRTWNHPVIVGNRLFVRNSKEAACFELPSLQTKSDGQTSAME